MFFLLNSSSVQKSLREHLVFLKMTNSKKQNKKKFFVKLLTYIFFEINILNPEQIFLTLVLSLLLICAQSAS